MRLPTVLTITHSPTESVARLGGWLSGAGVLLDVRFPYNGSPLPSLRGFSGLLVMGGAMGAYDDDVAPWLPATRDLLRDAVAQQVPTLGVCLGGQLLAAALGGQVKPVSEGPGDRAGAGRQGDVSAGDPLFGPVPFTPVLQWHWDEITTLPAGATLLASSSRYANQAFRVGEAAWGLQFHVETTPEMVRAWSAAAQGGWPPRAGTSTRRWPAGTWTRCTRIWPRCGSRSRPGSRSWPGCARSPDAGCPTGPGP